MLYLKESGRTVITFQRAELNLPPDPQYIWHSALFAYLITRITPGFKKLCVMSPAEQLAVFVEVVEIDQRFSTYVTLETRDTPNTGCSCALCEHTQL